MASGYTVNGVDFDDIFAPRSTTKRADVGFQIGGTDISNRYEKASSGSPAGNVGYQVNGSDIGPLFAGVGNVWNGSVSAVPSTITNTTIAPSQPNAALIFLDNGEIRRRAGGTTVLLGRWDGNDSYTLNNSQVRFVVTSGTASYNTASSYANLSSSREVGVVRNIEGGTAISVTVYLRDANNTSNVLSTSTTISATMTSL